MAGGMIPNIVLAMRRISGKVLIIVILEFLTSINQEIFYLQILIKDKNQECPGMILESKSEDIVYLMYQGISFSIGTLWTFKLNLARDNF